MFQGSTGDRAESPREATTAASNSADFEGERFADIEEALAELFDAVPMLAAIEVQCPTLREVRRKVERACLLLDRPWG